MFLVPVPCSWRRLKTKRVGWVPLSLLDNLLPIQLTWNYYYIYILLYIIHYFVTTTDKTDIGNDVCLRSFPTLSSWHDDIRTVTFRASCSDGILNNNYISSCFYLMQGVGLLDIVLNRIPRLLCVCFSIDWQPVWYPLHHCRDHTTISTTQVCVSEGELFLTSTSCIHRTPTYGKTCVERDLIRVFAGSQAIWACSCLSVCSISINPLTTTCNYGKRNVYCLREAETNPFYGARFRNEDTLLYAMNLRFYEWQ